MDWQDPQVQQAAIVAFWSLVVPLLMAAARKWWPQFELTEAKRKWLYAISAVAVATFISAPGTLAQKLVAAAVAAVLSQGNYLMYSNARGLRA